MNGTVLQPGSGDAQAPGMIIVHGQVLVQAEHVAEALTLSLAHVRRSRLEPGCIAHGVSQDVEQPGRLVFVEQWASMAALQAHFMVPDSRAFAKALGALAQERPTMTLYRADEVPMAAPSGR